MLFKLILGCDFCVFFRQYKKLIFYKYNITTHHYIMSKLEETLKIWCDENLALGRAYGCSGEPFKFEGVNPKGKLVYQDGVDCNYCAFNDVYLQEDDTYRIYTHCKIGSVDMGCFVKKCENIAEVMDYIAMYCEYTPNSVMKLLMSGVENNFSTFGLSKDKLREVDGMYIPHLSKCDDSDTELIKMIREYVPVNPAN